MYIKQWLSKSVSDLKQTGIVTARLDCLVLLEDATHKDKSYLLAHPELPLQNLVLKRLNQQIERRCRHEPLAYIRGKSEFYGREFKVTPDTLEPRPETETMIDLLKQKVASHKSLVASQKTADWRLQTGDNNFLLEDGPPAPVAMGLVDVGTGSGCLAVTAKLEIPNADVIATDISEACLKVARQNAKQHDAKIAFYRGNLLQPIPPSAFHLSSSIIMANLPYVPDSHTINEAAMHEPKTAIFGGEDGLDLYRRLFKQTSKILNKPRFILTESLPFQHQAMKNIAKAADYRLSGSEDFIQVFRIVD